MTRALLAAPLSVLLLGCPSGDPADGVATATDSASAGGSTSTSTSSTETTAEPAPEPESAGSACGEPLAGQWGDCINGNAQVCGNEEASCLANSTVNPAWGSCILPCSDRCDCWAAPEGADTSPECAAVLPGGETACVLDCTDGQACPSNMICVALTGVQSLCAYESDSFDPTTGEDPTTSGGDSSSTGDGSSSSSTGDGSSSSSGGSSSSSGG